MRGVNGSMAATRYVIDCHVKSERKRRLKVVDSDRWIESQREITHYQRLQTSNELDPSSTDGPFVYVFSLLEVLEHSIKSSRLRGVHQLALFDIASSSGTMRLKRWKNPSTHNVRFDTHELPSTRTQRSTPPFLLAETLSETPRNLI